jgi:hypothetical protein
MDSDLCPKTPKCPIFNGILKGTQFTETYKKLYCEAGEAGRNNCKRYQINQKTGKGWKTLRINMWTMKSV